MTSSLVGSEMCIRDRPEDSDGSRPGHRVSAAVGPLYHPLSLEVLRRLCACLLYTSDAADDM
eukprot:12658278-Prorocentrum_lima.AAC.1